MHHQNWEPVIFSKRPTSTKKGGYNGPKKTKSEATIRNIQLKQKNKKIKNKKIQQAIKDGRNNENITQQNLRYWIQHLMVLSTILLTFRMKLSD